MEYGKEYNGVMLNYGERVNFKVTQYEPVAAGGHRLVGGNNYEMRLTQSDATMCGELIGEVMMVPPSCPDANNGFIRLTLNNDLPSEFFWSNGANTRDIGNLAPGRYWVVVRNSNKCVERREFVLEDNSSLTTQMAGTPPRCREENGHASVSVTGGVAPYTYRWYRNGSPIDGATGNSIQGIGFGNYTVTVTDAQGCRVTGQTIFGDDFMNFRLAFEVTDASSGGSADGAIDLTPIDAMGPLTYYWSNGATTEDLTGLAPGEYSVIVANHMGCVANGTVTVGVTAEGNLQSVDSPNPDLTVLSVAPNPVNDLAEVKYSLRYSTPVRVEVYDALGALVAAYDQGIKSVGENSAWLPTSEYAPGRYSCRLIYKGGVSAVPFVVVR